MCLIIEHLKRKQVCCLFSDTCTVRDSWRASMDVIWNGEGGGANLKSHAYSHVKVGQPDSWRCFKVFQLYSSVTHFVLCKALLGEGSYVLQKTPFNMCFWQAISPLASSAVICVFELVHNKKVVLSLKKYHYFSFSCSKLISASSTTEDRVLVQLQLW